MSQMSNELKVSLFIPNQIEITDWNSVAPFFEELANYSINSDKDLLHWISQRSKLEEQLQENFAWRYIRYTCNTEDKKLLDDLNYYIEHIEPLVSKHQFELNKKLVNSQFVHQIENLTGYDIYIRNCKNEIKQFRNENLPIIAEINTLSNEYGQITGAFTINYNGKEYTFNQAANFLKNADRTVRKQVFELIINRRNSEKNKLNDLFSSLVALRHKVALNSGYSNYRDFMFDSLQRFDYTPDDCKKFNNSIKELIVPVCEKFDEERRKALKMDTLKPYDLDVDPDGNNPIKPYKNGDDLTEKTILCFKQVNPKYAGYIEEMKRLGHLDLDSRKGKAPGGYNYPLYKSGVPFIFMNSAESLRDMITMLHEGGHAVHSFLSNSLPITAFKNFPSEIAELASMSMELITMDYWNVFIENEDELKRAKKYHLEKIISVLPWISCIDEFQHWIYENPNHTIEQRSEYWAYLFKTYTGSVIDWSDYPEIVNNLWHKQLHLFEVPFYYIEYAIAQLGAIAMWRNYKTDKVSALRNFESALTAGNTQSLPQLYKTAGIQFSFDTDYVRNLLDFVLTEYRNLN
jgi:oligoendopeptidase F